MFALLRLTLFFFSLALFYSSEIQAQQKAIKDNPSIYVSDKLWEEVQDYLIPDNHPAKAALDAIFFKSRAIADQEVMIAAGFEPAKPQPCTKIIVTRHPHLPGYIIKAYLDITNEPNGRPDHYFLIKRIIGARLIRESIIAHDYEHLLKVPEKWLYLLPDEPSAPANYSRKLFILVEDDMDIFNDKKNEKLWKSDQVTKELLKALYVVSTEACLSDSTKPSNCPFSRDGRLAFVDTQMFNTGHMKYEKLTPYLAPDMRRYWKKLTED